MTYKLLDTVVLDRDLPQHSLRSGDLGAVVQLYEPNGLEVESVTASGKTRALVTLNVNDVRPVQLKPSIRQTVEKDPLCLDRAQHERLLNPIPT